MKKIPVGMESRSASRIATRVERRRAESAMPKATAGASTNNKPKKPKATCKGEMPPKRKAMPTTGAKATSTSRSEAKEARNFPRTMRHASMPESSSDS